jgi:transposase
MPRKSPFRVVLSAEEARELNARARKYTLAYFQVQRAKMILLAAQGLDNEAIARRLDTRREVVWSWRKRFLERRLDGLEEHPRPGRPRAFPPRGGRANQGPGL